MIRFISVIACASSRRPTSRARPLPFVICAWPARRSVGPGSGERVAVGCPPDKAFRAGDRIFKVSAGQAFNLSQSACRKRLESVTPGKAVIELVFKMPGTDRIEVTATSHGLSLSRHFSVESFPARDRPSVAGSSGQGLRQNRAAAAGPGSSRLWSAACRGPAAQPTQRGSSRVLSGAGRTP